jgi:signal transduction histidine kinase
LLAVLSHVNRAIAEANDRPQFFEDICRIVVERGNFRMAWISLVNRDTGHIDVASHFGYEEGYLSLLRITVDSNVPGGGGPTGSAIRENRYIINNNTQENVYMAPWRDEAIKRGYLSSAAFPIREHKQVIGALTVYISESAYFEKDEIELMQEIVDSISFAVDSFDHKQRRKKAEEERTRLEEQLLQSQKMESIGILAGGVAHDFNNILSAILGYGYIAQKMLKDDETTHGYIQEMLNSANRAAELTRGLLAFSRKQVMKPSLADLNEIVKDVDKMLRRILTEDIELNTVLSDGEIPILVDVGQMEQILMNLATNARDAMPDGGHLFIQTNAVNIDSHYDEEHILQNAGMYAVLTVSDTGVGMEQGTKESIFEPFFTTKEVGKGTGLGLSMVYGTVKQHNGNIDVYSEVGKGTTFKIYLPLAQTKPEATSAAIQTAPAGEGETIMIAEDESKVRESIRLILQDNGYKIIEAENGEDAVRKFRENRGAVSVILLDVVMPLKNGRAAYEEIKILEPEVKTIFMSGYADDIISKKGILEEGFDLISKPINPVTLMRKIRDVLDR